MGCAVCSTCPYVHHNAVRAHGDRFEVHLTVDNYGNYNRGFEASFEHNVTKYGAKALFINNFNYYTGRWWLDLISSQAFDTYSQACIGMETLRLGLKMAGFHVVRQKIEATPWTLHGFNEDSYYEAHFEAIMPVNSKRMGFLKKKKLYVSSNREKDNCILTFRRDVGHTKYEKMKERVDQIEKQLLAEGWGVKKVILEKTIYDSNLSHDNNWIHARKAT